MAPPAGASVTYNCSACRVRCLDQKSLEVHLAGKKHKKQVESSSQPVPTTRPPARDIVELAVCELCWHESSGGPDGWKRHLRSSLHRQKLSHHPRSHKQTWEDAPKLYKPRPQNPWPEKKRGRQIKQLKAELLNLKKAGEELGQEQYMFDDPAGNTPMNCDICDADVSEAHWDDHFHEARHCDALNALIDEHCNQI